MTPAPITISFFGTLPKVSAPVEVTTVFSSTSTPLSGDGSDPEAMMMFLAVCVSLPTVTLPASGMEAQPLIQSILFFLNRNSMPLVFCPIVSSL